jgi:rhomboid protease GluP
VAVNAALFIAEKPFSADVFRERLIALGARTSRWHHEPWRLLTSLFLHGSVTHLLFNMFMLAVLGQWVGRIFGWGRALGLYLAGGILGNIIGEAIGRPGGADVPAVGASTAILALLGALLGATYWSPERVPLAARIRFRWAIPMVLLLTLGLGIVVPVVDNGAHLGGFIAGLALAAVVPGRSKRS